jgi:hypothetical protein
MDREITKQKILLAVQRDPTLDPEEKVRIAENLNDAMFYNKIVKPGLTTGAGFAIAKFFELSKPAQALITLAGYGIGRYLLDESDKHDKFLQYNKETGNYKINA